MSQVSESTIREGIKKFSWYHKIDLGHGIITPGREYDHLWQNIRNVREEIDYSNKNVLDVGSWDGMWAFEAEKMDADVVVATDCSVNALNSFLFCKSVLNSKVLPYYNVSPYNLFDRLDVLLHDLEGELFDIVQHLGVLYHLRDPMLSLSQARSMLKTGGYLLLETGGISNVEYLDPETKEVIASLEDVPSLIFNGVPPPNAIHHHDEKKYWWRLYKDVTTWWAPTVASIREMLKATLFEPLDNTLRIIDVPTPAYEMYSNRIIKYKRSRIAVVAEAVGTEDVSKIHANELKRTYRNPGLKIA